MSEELQLYVITKRRARVGGKQQFVELISKLFGNLYMEDDIDDFIDNEIEEMKLKR